MLNRQYRLKNNEIAEIARKGRKFQGELFDIRVWYSINIEHSKFAFAVSTKIDKKAVIRNRIKRKLRAAVYSLEKNKEFKLGKYLFIVKSAKIADLKSNQLEIYINQQLSLSKTN